MADREGRLEYRPKKIKAELLPYDNCNIDELINQLSGKRFITIYSIDNEKYIEVNNFLKHQTPHIKEQASTIPAPDKNQTSTSVESLIPDSLNLIPDSGFQDTSAPDETGALSGSEKEVFVLPGWISVETWKAFLEVRKKKKAAGTDYALKLIVLELEKIKKEYGHDPIEVLNKSIKSGWSDVYPLKTSGGNNGNGNSTGFNSSAKTVGAKACGAQSDGEPYPPDKEY
ncbi:MAG: hypothetical protein AB2L12_17505 [Smithellaceae bacterium]